MESTREIENFARYAFFRENTATFLFLVNSYFLLPQLEEHRSCSLTSKYEKEATQVVSLPDPKSYHPICNVVT